MNPEIADRLRQLRLKAADGTITDDELREGITLMREGRVAAAATSAQSRTRKAASAKKAAINSDDLLSELDAL